jgi:hypothetical protein
MKHKQIEHLDYNKQVQQSELDNTLSVTLVIRTTKDYMKIWKIKENMVMKDEKSLNIKWYQLKLNVERSSEKNNGDEKKHPKL